MFTVSVPAKKKMLAEEAGERKGLAATSPD
jgi:hypothetical protein